MTAPRGIRNNNPLNIRVGNKWVGEVKSPTDPSFEQFTCMPYGLRAAFIILRRYIEVYKLNTISKIVSRWAPSSENNTLAYIRRVSISMIYDADAPISFNDKPRMIALVKAMCIVECGCPVDNVDIEAGYILAAYL